MIHGIINVYKEKGYTSHDVVAKMRGILKQKKIGHTGTLDPEAEGVLPVCLGKGTKLCDVLVNQDKTYEAVLLLGIETDTQDTTGSKLRQAEVTVKEEEITAAVMGFMGAYAQIPPMYSALKHNGKKLYELARAGQEIERPARYVTIHEIAICSIELPRVYITVKCSKGTYIRTLCYDIGRKLGCGGCMEALTRIQTGGFRIEDSLKLAEIEKLQKENEIFKAVIPIDKMFSGYPKAFVSSQFHILVHNGNPLEAAHFIQKEELTKDCPVRVYDEDRRFIGIYQYDKNKLKYQPLKIFYGD